MCMRGSDGLLIEYEILSFIMGGNLRFLCQMLNYSSGSRSMVPEQQKPQSKASKAPQMILIHKEVLGPTPDLPNQKL